MELKLLWVYVFGWPKLQNNTFILPFNSGWVVSACVDNVKKIQWFFQNYLK